MKRWIILVVLLCLASVDAQAQLRPVTKTLQSAAAATQDGDPINVDGFSTVGVQVTISNTATVTFEATQNLSTWQAVVCTLTSSTSATLVSTATATGTYHCNVAGMVQFRVRVSAYTSGTITVTATASPAVLGRKGGGSGGGAPTDATYLTATSNGTLSNEVVIGVVDDTVIVANGSTWEAKTLPSCSNATTSKLLYNTTTNAFSCGTDQDSGVGSGMTHPQVMARASIGF